MADMTPFLLSQILIGIAIITDIISFQLKERKHILICLMISCSLIAAHFVLLEQWTAAGLGGVAIFRFLLSLKTTSRVTMWVFIGLAAGIGLATYDGMLSILTCAGSMLGTAASFSKTDKHLRELMFLGTTLWLINNIIIGSPAAVFMEAIFIGSNVVGYFRYYIKPVYLVKKKS